MNKCALLALLATHSSAHPTSWQRTSDPVSGDTIHDVVLALPQRNLDILERTLLEVSNPTHFLYGQYLSFEEVGKLVAPLPTDQQAVREWLESHNFIMGHHCHATAHGEYFRCSAPVSMWKNALVDADFQRYAHLEHSGVSVVRALGAQVPSDVAPHLTGMFLASNLPADSGLQYGGFRHQRIEKAEKADAAPYCHSHPCTFPTTLNKAYNITSNDGGGHGSMSVFETSGQYMSPADLALYQKTYSIPKHPVDVNVGGNSDDNTCKYLTYECGEANLDIQTIMAVAQNVETTFWSTPKTTTFAHWITDMANATSPPLVHSVSYGQDEEETDAVSKQTFTNEAMKLGVRGVSVLVSSGDDGVAGAKARRSTGLCDYNPQWPATSPYVTTVGATEGPEVNKKEVACSANNSAYGGTFITSGGGFSETFSSPKYQTESVAQFLGNSKNNTFGPGYNVKGRGYPDVALIGHLYPIFVGGAPEVKDGTSASTPVMAGILALVNAKRIAAGKPSVGFANPALYQWAGDANIFHDITSGDNSCTAATSLVPTKDVTCCETNGFRAVKGWDPVTGLGSVNAGNMIDAWAAL
jgi:tripeptidyl-peptidase I